VWRAVLAMAAGNNDVADEATCEAFARLYAYRDGVRDPVAWVFRTAFRLASREMKRQRHHADSDVPEAIAGEVSVLPYGVARGLRRLSPEQRSAVFLHYFADMPVGEVARLSGCAGGDGEGAAASRAACATSRARVRGGDRCLTSFEIWSCRSAMSSRRLICTRGSSSANASCEVPVARPGIRRVC
jgi:RNA polymerase sigma-70 factor (ECF subfamily)